MLAASAPVSASIIKAPPYVLSRVSNPSCLNPRANVDPLLRDSRGAPLARIALIERVLALSGRSLRNRSKAFRYKIKRSVRISLCNFISYIHDAFIGNFVSLSIISFVRTVSIFLLAAFAGICSPFARIVASRDLASRIREM